ncbi:hypothetical protein SLH46_12310 [Draconibacterium sp. IB214405]|uniref:hypothetical protein n=1 Tax=Draconibacterium sp. IB214405 TaxID=3097352 RepID=UPI002A0D138F|nr:hypothetical protein [Draconibacterium sp. IB214405]MDX8339974.1 hypothetical protein [Draconibacterium sp. IB214405]
MRSFFIIFLLLFAVQSIAQQGLQMDFGEVDSTEVIQQRQLEYYNFINGGVANDLLLSDLELPDLDFYEAYRNRYTLHLSLNPNNILTSGFSFNGDGMITTPFYNAEMLSSAAYKLGDKFVVGGFSYGANSALSAPLPNQNSSYFDAYGSTMFFQYKVSKKFKIETSINIQQNGHNPMGF